MQKKEAPGESEVPAEVSSNLSDLDKDKLTALSVNQIKNAKIMIDVKQKETEKEMVRLEQLRHESLVKIGNLLHPSVPVSNDEVCSLLE